MRRSFFITLTTTGSLSEARKIAKAAVYSRTCACVNIIPNIRSIYRWKGRIEESREYLLFFKTSRSKTTELAHIIRRHHSYELPEIITLPIAKGELQYLKWIEESLKR